MLLQKITPNIKKKETRCLCISRKLGLIKAVGFSQILAVTLNLENYEVLKKNPRGFVATWDQHEFLPYFYESYDKDGIFGMLMNLASISQAETFLWGYGIRSV